MSDFIEFTQADGAKVLVRKSNVLEVFSYCEESENGLKMIGYYRPNEQTQKMEIVSQGFLESYCAISGELLE